jgi:hypothetical protein
MPTDNFEKRGKLNASGHGGCVGPHAGSGQSPGGGPGGEAPGSSWVFILFRWSKMHFLLVLYQLFSLNDIVLL